MNGRTLAAIILIVAGGAGLLYGGFSFTKDRHTAKLGALEMTVRESESVQIPVWLGIGALVAGGLLLFGPGRKS